MFFAALMSRSTQVTHPGYTHERVLIHPAAESSTTGLSQRTTVVRAAWERERPHYGQKNSNVSRRQDSRRSRACPFGSGWPGLSDSAGGAAAAGSTGGRRGGWTWRVTGGQAARADPGHEAAAADRDGWRVPAGMLVWSRRAGTSAAVV